jgi:(1->4)-alpha-D-glucan 1-alpha-D-glucosylmutase
MKPTVTAHPLRATVRLQLHAGFTLDDAAAQVDYFARLGISHLYLSPIGRAVPGSNHGYDNTDPTRVNPELGGEPALRRLSQAARAQGLGLLLDIVPNHMATHADNAWWMDLLRHGRQSRHAEWFDVDWDAPDAGGRLLLPVLDRPLHAALAEGLLSLEQHDDGWYVRHHDQAWPLTPGTVDAPAGRRVEAWRQRINAGARRGDGALAAILERQAWRLLWWRAGNDRINYRRFFDITSLVALRCERAEVFRAVHALPLRLLAEGVIDGVRVDHVDGLTDPAAYVQALRAALDRAGARRGLAPGQALLYVEKILAPGEQLPANWNCHGTTGYDFMDQVGAALHDAAGVDALTDRWAGAGGERDFAAVERQARLLILRGPLQAEFNRCLRRLLQVAAQSPALADLSAQMWARALQALCVHFPVYRTYAAAGGLDADGGRYLDGAAKAAARDLGPAEQLALETLAGWLREGAGRDLQRLRAGFEQLTAPLNAKAVEDTAFYRHGPLLSRNEVGSHPVHAAAGIEGFHRSCRLRARNHPLALLATATHDHKRGEDTRARLAAISHRPQWWIEQLDAFEAATPEHLRDAVPATFRLMLWQTLVAAWPFEGLPANAAGSAFAERINAWATKALREGKQYSSWTEPDAAIEDAVQALIRHAVQPRTDDALQAALGAAAAALGVAGARLGLAQLALKLTAPGVPDTYQGTEGWDLSLVDPDNRRAVDYDARRAWLEDPRDWQALLRQWQDGAVKARLLATLLALRAEQPRLLEGGYRPEHVGDDVVAFRRTAGRRLLWVGALVADAGASEDEGLLLPDTCWNGRTVALPAGTWRSVMDSGELELAQSRDVPLSTLFARAPVAVWVRQ